METNEVGVAKRRMRPKAERRRIVEETFRPGASVARVARAHGVNANQVFNWRRLYQQGRLEVEATARVLVPVRITDSIGKERPSGAKPRRGTEAGVIDIDLGHARVRIEGGADPACVRAALEGLVR